MTGLDLFAGAGGAFLGLHRAGVQHVACVEWSADACRALQLATGGALLPPHEAVGHRMPGLVRCMDVRDLDPPPADVWWSSPPCQAWSTAGAKLGAQDKRNGWPWVWQAYDRAAVKPRWLFVENVAGMTHHSSAGCGDATTCAGCYLSGVVLPTLRARFPHVVSRVLDAADYGVPQHRRRLIIVASVEPYNWPAPTHGPGLTPWRTMGEALALDGALAIGGGSNPHGADRAHERTYVDLTDRPCTTVAAVQVGNAGPWLVSSTERRRLTVAECATLQGFPAGWPWHGTKAEQYRQVGNAVPPALAAALVGQVVA